jgi:hypothetical protein
MTWSYTLKEFMILKGSECEGIWRTKENIDRSAKQDLEFSMCLKMKVQIIQLWGYELLQILSSADNKKSKLWSYRCFSIRNNILSTIHLSTAEFWSDLIVWKTSMCEVIKYSIRFDMINLEIKLRLVCFSHNSREARASDREITN